MAGRVYLISCDYLKENSTINNNVDNNLLNNSIWEGQSIHIQQILGTCLYKAIIELVRSGDIATPQYADYKNLLDEYIQPCTAYWAWYEVIPYIAMKVVNKGIERQSSDYSQPSQLNEMEYLRDEIRNKAEFYSQRLTAFLTENKSHFPEYAQSCGCKELSPTHNQYFSGIQFDHDPCGCL